MFVSKNIILLSFCISSLASTACFGAGVDFIDNSLDDFVGRVIDNENERELFKRYYAELQTKMSTFETEKKKNIERYLYKIGLQGLEADRPEWHASIKPFISDPRLTLDQDLNKIREVVAGFLNRYGAYQEFSSRVQRARSDKGVQVAGKDTEKESVGFFNRITGSLAQFSNKLVGLFESRFGTAV